MQIKTWDKALQFKEMLNANGYSKFNAKQHGRGLEQNDIISIYVSKTTCSFWFNDNKICDSLNPVDPSQCLFAISCQKCVCHRGSGVLSSGFQFEITIE